MIDQYGKPHRSNIITCTNVNNALPQGISMLKHFGRRARPRGMEVLEMDMPIMTKYLRPEQCVLIDDTRLCNPFFHLIEALWILNGRSNVSTLEFYNSKIGLYSDDGETFHGAYGHRLRGSRYNVDTSVDPVGFHMEDQLAGVIDKLKSDPMSRQAVALIWRTYDLFENSKDIPCNDMLMFTLRENVLDMTIICRSNDVIWGAYGANAVQFSFILQYVAAGLGARTGYMYQISNNYHAYMEDASAGLWKKLSTDKWLSDGHDPYVHMGVHPFPLIGSEYSSPQAARENFDYEVDLFLRIVDEEIELFEKEQVSVMSFHEYLHPKVFTQPFILNVALPLHIIWLSRKMRKLNTDVSDTLYGDVTTQAKFDMKIDWLAAAVHWCQVTDMRKDK